MQFHHHGYVSTNPRVSPAQDKGINRSKDVPDEVDVLIVGSGPAGMLLAAQLSQYPTISTYLVEKREGRLEIGQADGIQARSVETFQAFGFAQQITQEAYQICEMSFWGPSKQNPNRIERISTAIDDEHGISEFPHLIVNQARVLDYFAEVAKSSAGRIEPNYGIEFINLTVDTQNQDPYPVSVTLKYIAGDNADKERIIKAKYVVGCDGAHSNVRKAIGRKHIGAASLHAWGVIDMLAVTDFPDIRVKCAINSTSGNILLIPREGGHLFRVYVDMGKVTENDKGNIRQTPLEDIIAKANAILSPYKLDVKEVAWWSIYEVGHRVTDKFDDVDTDKEKTQMPHVFICGDACHTHSAKAGQGMNVSIQDGFNLGWKLGAVLTGQSPESLLCTYSAERQVIAQNLIDFDKEWSSLMARKPDEFKDPNELSNFYVQTAEFPAGFMTQYQPSIITGKDNYQTLAKNYTVGKRFKSELVTRVSDKIPVHIGHHATADGRWRIYVFADSEHQALNEWATWMLNNNQSPVNKYTPKGKDIDSIFDIKVIYPQKPAEIEITNVPKLFLPTVGPWQLIDYEKAYALHKDVNIFETRGIGKEGAVIVVRPDQYVAHVLPLSATDELTTFFANNMLEQ